MLKPSYTHWSRKQRTRRHQWRF